MGRYFGYMRISTKEERGKQKFSRQEKALFRWCKDHDVDIPERKQYRDDCSGTSFDRASWKELEEDLLPGDTIVMKDITRFTREYEGGFRKYMELLNEGISLVFLDNPTISTEYIQNMMDVADKQQNRIAKKTLKDTIELLLLVELDRAEKERELTVQRIKDGIAASKKKSGRRYGQLDKMTPSLEDDIIIYLKDRSVKQSVLMKKHGISRNTLKKYINVIKQREVKT